MKRRKILLGLLGCMLAASVLTGCGSSSKNTGRHLLVAHAHSETHPVHIGMTALCDQLEEDTDFTCSIYPNGQLGGNSEMIQMVKAGVLDIAKVSASSLEQFNEAYSIFSLPYVFVSQEHYFKVMRESAAVQEIFKSTYDQGFFAIGWYDAGQRSIYTIKDEPADSPAALAGMKIRTQDSPTSIEMIRNMGASATPMSYSEVYSALQQGIIDGAENAEGALADDGHGEVVKSYTYTEHQYTPDIIIISTKTWESMTESEQQALYQATNASWEKHEEAWNKMIERNINAAKEMGVKFYNIDKTPFIEAVQSQHDAFRAKSEDNSRYLDDFLSYADR